MGFLNAHQRFPVPAVLGPCVSFNNGTERVPDIIAFMNDGEVAVTLHFDAANNKAQVTATINGTYNIGSGSSDQLVVAIDGEAPVTVTLSAGATRSAANIVSDINAALVAAGGNTALASASVSGTAFTIRSGTLGQFSSVALSTPPTHSSYTVLGLTAGTHTADDSFQLDIVSPLTVVAKGQGVFTNPRKSSPGLRVRGQVGDGTGTISTMIDATTLFGYSGVQQ